MGVAAAPSPLRRQRLKRQDSYGNEQRATSNEQATAGFMVSPFPRSQSTSPADLPSEQRRSDDGTHPAKAVNPCWILGSSATQQPTNLTMPLLSGGPTVFRAPRTRGTGKEALWLPSPEPRSTSRPAEFGWWRPVASSPTARALSPSHNPPRTRTLLHFATGHPKASMAPNFPSDWRIRGPRCLTARSHRP
jgi:hypothetical protein